MYFTAFQPSFFNDWKLLVNGCSSGIPNPFLPYVKVKGFIKLHVVERISEGKFTLDEVFNQTFFAGLHVTHLQYMFFSF